MKTRRPDIALSAGATSVGVNAAALRAAAGVAAGVGGGRGRAKATLGATQAHARLVAWCRANRLPEPVPEHRFHPQRKWRFDFFWKPRSWGGRWPGGVALELEGLTYQGGRHQRLGGYTEDCAKYAAALTLGIAVLRVTPRQFKSGAAFRWLGELLRKA